MSEKVIRIARELSRGVQQLRFGPPVAYVYNPLDYAWATHRAFLKRFVHPEPRALLVGMNPGPFGMVQTGVPFGEVNLVREWLGIEGRIGRPAREHPKRPIEGFACSKSEVSGQRLWGWARQRFGKPEEFFRRFFVWNYCPLAFMEESGRNRTPDKLPASERQELYALCDRALVKVTQALKPDMVIGIGKFAMTRAQQVLNEDVRVETILHPSPASPIANRGWAEQAEKQLEELGVLGSPRQASSPRTTSP